MQAKQSMLDRIQRKQLKWYGHLLTMEVVVGQRRFTSEHRTIGGEEEYRNNHGITKGRTS
jgi:hypothetical protein